MTARLVLALLFLAMPAMAGAGAGARAGEVAVRVQGVRNDQGSVVVGVCAEEVFIGGTCAFCASVPARAGAVTVTVPDVPPGTYAVRVYHDENGNERIDRNFLGVPLEGFGFGNDAPVRMAPPSFKDAAVTVGPDRLETSLTLRYWLSP